MLDFEGRETLLWAWWGWMAVLGLGMGLLAALSQGAGRVFMKTLAVPVVIVALRLLLPGLYPAKNSAPYAVLDYAIIAVTGLIGDYLLGLKLGRHDRAGFRSDSVGH